MIFMFNSKFFKILIPLDVKSLSMNERIMSILIYTLPFSLFSLIEFFFLGYFTLEVLCIYYIFFFPIAYYLLAYEKLEKKYKIYSDIRFGNTFEFFSKMMASFAPGCILFILFFCNLIDKLNYGILISFSFVIPALGLFFRTNIFNDESCFKGEKIIFGYNPIRYGPLSLIIGICGYINVLQLHDINLSILLFIVTLIFQILFVIPDQFNKILPIEIREIKGFLSYICLLILSYSILFFIITGGNFINGINFNLSLEGIIRKVIVYSTAIILAILFVKQIKNMNNK